MERRVDDRGGSRGAQGGCDVARRDLRVRSRARVGAERRVGAARISRGKPRDPPEGASGLRDDDLARVRWRERRGTRRRVSRGRRTYLLIAEERPDGSRSSARRAEARATAAAGSARLARHISAPRRVASLAGRDSGRRARRRRGQSRARKRRHVRVTVRPMSLDPSGVAREVSHAVRSEGVPRMRGRAASRPHTKTPISEVVRYFARLWAPPRVSNPDGQNDTQTLERTGCISPGKAQPRCLSPGVLSTFTTTPRRARTPQHPQSPHAAREGVSAELTPPESVRSVAPRYPVIQPSRARAPSPRLLRALDLVLAHVGDERLTLIVRDGEGDANLEVGGDVGALVIVRAGVNHTLHALSSVAPPFLGTWYTHARGHLRRRHGRGDGR